MAAIRKEIWPHGDGVRWCFDIEFLARRPRGCRAIQWRIALRGVQDDIIAAPVAAPAVYRRTKRSHCTTGNLNRLQKSISEKPDGIALRRPERVAGCTGAGQ